MPAIHRMIRHATTFCVPIIWGFLVVVGVGQDTDRKQPVSIRQSPLDKVQPTNIAINLERERLYNELAEEFSTFDRLGYLVRRVSHLVKPSVIHIEAHKVEQRGAVKESFDEAGSGVIVELGSGENWVLTNRHVISGAKAQDILLRSHLGKEFHPSKIVSDESSDVALLKIDQTDLPAARIGDSRSIEIGDFVIAIGSPFGLSHSVTFGILSAKGRRDLSLGDQKIELQDFFQTDAAINPGNSGGPLLNLRGEVVGVNTAIASSSGGSEGIGFAIPMQMAMKVAEQLVAYGELRRGYLGVTLDPEFTMLQLGDSRIDYAGGAMVKSVRRGSPAELARLQRGDVIVEFNGSAIDDDDHLVTLVGLTAIGEAIPMVILRSGTPYRTEVVLTNLN